MAYNVPNYDTGNLSFGPAVIYIGTACGVTPATDIGAVADGMALSHAVDLLEVKQGNPQELIESFRVAETVEFAFSGLEWNVDNLPEFIGAGSTSGEVFRYGGQLRTQQFSMRIIHQMPPAIGATIGATIIIDLWCVRSSGDLTLTFGMDLHNFPVTVACMNRTTDWAGSVLAEGEQYYKLQIMEAP